MQDRQTHVASMSEFGIDQQPSQRMDLLGRRIIIRSRTESPAKPLKIQTTLGRARGQCRHAHAWRAVDEASPAWVRSGCRHTSVSQTGNRPVPRLGGRPASLCFGRQTRRRAGVHSTMAHPECSAAQLDYSFTRRCCGRAACQAASQVPHSQNPWPAMIFGDCLHDASKFQAYAKRGEIRLHTDGGIQTTCWHRGPSLATPPQLLVQVSEEAMPHRPRSGLFNSRADRHLWPIVARGWRWSA